MIHHIEVQVLVLLLIASLVGMGARRLRLPYTLALVVAGLVLGFVNLEPIEGMQLTPELLMLLFLPPLLFEAAFHLSIVEFRRNVVQILFLAVPGVAVAVTLTALLAYAGIHLTGLEPRFTLGAAFLFAAVISATDPISVLALFKEFGAPRRLYLLVEGESLVNDGVAVVIFGIVLTILGLPDLHGDTVALSGGGEIVAYALVTLVKTGIGGVLVGALVGAIMSLVTRHVDDHLIEITLTSVVAWGSFLVAEELHVSGVLSTVTAGMVVGSFGTRYGMSATTRMAVNDFWAYMGFLSNSFIFLLIGLELESSSLFAQLPMIIIGFSCVVLGRAGLVYGLGPLVDRFSDAIPRSWRHVMVWGGLRGSLSMVLVLGLPPDLAYRDLLVTLVFGVVAGSLFLQGMTVAKLMARLGLASTMQAGQKQYEVARGAGLASAHALHAAEELHKEGLLDHTTFDRLATWYRERRDSKQAEARSLAGDTERPERMLEGVKTLAAAEREWIRHAAQSGVLSVTAANDLNAAIDDRIQNLDEAAHHGEPQLVEELETMLNKHQATEG